MRWGRSVKNEMMNGGKKKEGRKRKEGGSIKGEECKVKNKNGRGDGRKGAGKGERR